MGRRSLPLTLASVGLLTVIAFAGAGALMAFSPGGAMTSDVLAHCKSPNHLVLRARAVKRAALPVSVRYVARMDCHNQPGYTGWGIVVSVRPHEPLEGLHLYPATATWLVDQLVSVADAAQPGESVTIMHTTNKTFSEFVTVTPAGALELAAAIQAAEPAG